MAEEVVDPKPIIEEGICICMKNNLIYILECSQSHHCLQTSEKLKSCTARVEGGATEECVEEFFDFMVKYYFN